MESGRAVSVVAASVAVAVLVIPCFPKGADAFRGGGAVAGPRGGGAIEGPRGGEAVEGPRGGKAAEGPRGGEAVEGPRGGVEVGTRYDTLPGGARPLVVGGRTYYVDGDVYYAPCIDDPGSYCVVPAPQ